MGPIILTRQYNDNIIIQIFLFLLVITNEFDVIFSSILV